MAMFSDNRRMMSDLAAFVTNLSYFIPIGLVLLALLVGVGIIAVPERATAAERIERSLRIDDQQRTYAIYLPDNLARKRDLRVMFVFHPGQGSGEFMEKTTRLHDLPGSENFIVIYPNGVSRTWNAGPCCGAAKDANIDDVAFFKAMMKDVATMASIRPKAYLTGYSNGAMLTYHLMCAAGDQVAAAAPFAGFIAAADLRDCRGGPVPLMHIHGADDEGMPIEGGNVRYFGRVPPLTKTVEWIARRNGADLSSPTRVDMPLLDSICTRYSGATAESETGVCIIPGLGHVWPGANVRIKRFGASRPEVKGSQAIIDFFLRF